ncbi:copper fist DNA binding domain-containing protein, partial [Phascolomyces articulosus]
RKFSCMTCIKGHRSTKCTHNQRELFEIKPKGRPVSQCEGCRELRKTRRIHIKCSCKNK